MISISIIIPIYKVEQYVSRCIKSIFYQDNCGAFIECIIVDDCSPDNSMSIIQSLISDYHGSIRFVFLKHERNKGLSATRNTGIDAAHGDYIMFVDSDDWLPAGSILKFVNVLKEYPNVDLIAGNSYYASWTDTFPTYLSEKTFLCNFQLRKYMLNYQNINCSAWNKLIRASFLCENKFKDGIIFEDKYWTYFLFNDISQAVFIPDVTYIYENNHPHSIINTSKSKENTSLHINSVSVMVNDFLVNPYRDLYADTLLYLLKVFIIAYRLKDEQVIRTEDIIKLNALRKRIVLDAFKNRRFFLFFFVYILTYPPTTYMFNIGWVRCHYNHIEKIGRVIANFFEKFHRN